MPNTATVTGKHLGGIAIAAKLFRDISRVTFDLNGTLRLLKPDGVTENIDISAASTITVTISSGNYTFTIS